MITASIITILVAMTVNPTTVPVFEVVNDLPAPIEAVEAEPETPPEEPESVTEAEYEPEWYWEPQYYETDVTADYSGSNDAFDADYGVTWTAPSDGLNSFTGVNYHEGRTETYYSSNVLYHYRTPEWTLDDEGFWRTDEGYYVVAASDMEQGTTFEGSKGTCIVLDCGCAPGITDYYVNWR